MSSLANISRIKWACRRGMLELDLLLTMFVADEYSLLSASDQATFVEMLSLPDPTLFAWLLGKEKPDQKDFAEIVKKIRDHAQSKF